MLIFFTILFLFAFFVLSSKKLDWAVMLIIAGLPLYLIRFKLFGLPMTMLEAMILIAFFCWLIFQTRFKDFLRGRYGLKDYWQNSPFTKSGRAAGRKFYPFGAEIILLLIISFIAAGTAHFSSGSLGIWKAYFFEPALLFILILNLFQNKDGVNKIGLSLAVGALAVSAYAIFQKLTGLG
ncbi:MAG TPA: hypothetical protein VMD74_05180, partial [Candidatus Methylomirabilis sp.]|nr:hypothetical protein [Candidatus Methylomirabilis sp.]